ncbi:MAG: alpha-amylase [Promethearchaeia archaeon]|nr:MAG: alpha-amylase [Candidatus Lokiarchaeia archaeon]
MRNFPRILEINTWPWFHSFRRNRQVNSLEHISITDWQELTHNFDTIWLMGIWQRSETSKRIAQTHPGLLRDFQQALPDFQPVDIVGSPYAIKSYTLDPFFGPPSTLEKISQTFHQLEKKIIVDLIPNHIAIDNDWLISHPEFFLHGSPADLLHNPEDFFKPPIVINESEDPQESAIFVHGKDPYFPSWTDTAQLNAFSAQYRREIISILNELAQWVDGVRCDMAMLLTDRIFKETWKNLAGKPLEREFWVDVISAVKERHPHFLFIAEVYWDMEWELQQQGFDFCYDKRLYDRLIHASVDGIRAHLTASWDYQSKLVRFIENHDENRAQKTFGEEKSKTVATLAFTLPGAYLHHYGEQLGWNIRLPVQLSRFPFEKLNQNINQFYQNLFNKTFLKYQFKDAKNGKSQSQSESISWAFNTEIPEPLIGYMWYDQKECEYFIVNFSSVPQNLTSLSLNFQKNGIQVKFDTISKINWQSLTNSSRRSSFLIEQDITERALEFNPWEVLLLKFHYC